MSNAVEEISKRKVSVVAAFALVVLVAALAIWSRSRGDERTEVAGETTITSVTLETHVVPNDLAIERLSYVICAHAAACSDPMLPHDNDECSADHRTSLGLELGQAEPCGAGIDAASLERCVSKIESEPCDQPAHEGTRLALCRASALCPSH